MAQDTEKLLPCAFCGSDHVDMCTITINSASLTSFFVSCARCNCRGPEVHEHVKAINHYCDACGKEVDAAKKWNMRYSENPAIVAPSQENFYRLENVQLRKRLEKLEALKVKP